MEKDYQEALGDIYYFKISPHGFFNGMMIVMYPNEPTFTGYQNFDFEAFDLFLKTHLETFHQDNPICFPKSCWKLKGKPQPIWMRKWLNSYPVRIRTDKKIGEGGHYDFPKRLIKK
jgi:hypothetical protein